MERSKFGAPSSVCLLHDKLATILTNDIIANFRNPWEGVNLLPFIDIRLLKETIATHCPPEKLGTDERNRNSMGKVFCYRYDPTCTDVVPTPNEKIGLSDIAESHSSVTTHDEKLGLSNIVFEPKLIDGTQIPYPGFPSLNVLPIASAELISAGLNCFGYPSKYPNIILTMHQMPELPPIEVLADNVIGKSLFVNWPMMHEARVVAVSNNEKEIRMLRGNVQSKEHTKLAADRWAHDSEMMVHVYHIGNGVPGSGGIQIGDIKVRLKVLPLQGMKTNNSNGSTKKVFGNEEADIPLQLALWHAPVPDPRFIERGPMTLQDRFPIGCNVVLTKGKLRGCKGTVVAIPDQKNVGVKVMTLPPEIPFGLAIARSVQEVFISSADAARALKINPGVFGKIMGRLPFEQGRYDLGLNLKSSDGMCVVGYTRRKVEKDEKGRGKKDESAWTVGDAVLVVGSRTVSDDSLKEDRIQWEYTPNAIRLVNVYRSKFPQLFDALNKRPNEKKYDAYQVFGKNGEAWLPVVREWLDSHESAKLPRSPTTTESMSYEATTTVQTTADLRSIAIKKMGYPKESLVKIPGSALYRECSTGATDVLLPSDLNDSDRPELGERIVNLCADGVPFGARGTVIAIHEAASSGTVEVLMDEEFIGGTSLQGHCANFRGKLCHWSHLLKITPENGKGLVDKLVPESKQAAIDQAVKAILNEKTATPVRLPSNQEAADSSRLRAKSGNSVTPTRPSSSGADRAKSRTPPRSASRAGSTGRSRQITWKEARGPDEKGVGFKGLNQSGMNGLVRWKKIINSKPPKKANLVPDVKQTAQDLKKMLGLTTKPPAVDHSTTQVTAANELKAILGVNAKPTVTAPSVGQIPTTAHKEANSVSDGLKALLGVVSPPQPAVMQESQHQQQQGPAHPSTAAEKLLQLMAGKQPQGPPPFMPGPPMSSTFNFTYVEVGKEAPNTPQPQASFYPNYNLPPYGGYNMPGFGGPPPLQNPSMFATHGSMAPFSAPPPPSAPMDEFPPLTGAVNPAGVAADASAATTRPTAASSSTLRPSSVLVPGIVQGKR
jgi:5'-3' exoribonuclease 1